MKSSFQWKKKIYHESYILNEIYNKSPDKEYLKCKKEFKHEKMEYKMLENNLIDEFFRKRVTLKNCRIL